MADPLADALKHYPLTLEKSAAPEYDARFILSAATPDRVKDTIDPKAYAPNLGKRVAALWSHDREKLPIGYWDNLKVMADQLVGDLKLSSIPLGQMVKTLLKDGVPLMASIGFRGKGEPLDNGGVHFTQVELLETSLVVVGAHPRAVQIQKQYGFMPGAAGQPPERARTASTSPAAAAARSAPQRKPMSKTISQLVVETQDAQVALVDKLATESTKLGETAAGTDEFTTQKAVVDGIDVELQAVDGKLVSLKSAEARLAKGAQPVAGSGSAAVVQFRDKSKDTDNLLGKLALCVFESGVRSKSLDLVAATRFPNSQAVETIVKAAQNPAMTNVPGYAQELTRQTYGQFIELLRGAAILPQCTPAAQSHSFDGSNSIYVPTRLGGTASGVFRAEGAPIPVKGITFSHITLTPKNLGVILTATMEMLRRSSIDLASYFESAMRDDTARALDQLFISNTAGSAIAPAGIRNGLTAPDTRASTGATAAQITNDLKIMLKALTANDMGAQATTRWLMHPSNLIAVSMLLTATGSPQFPEAASGRLAGYQVVTSTQFDPAIVLLVDFAHITFALGSPAFEASTVATIHEEDTTPLPLSTGTSGATAVTAAPVRSLYQTNSWALRLLLDADWAKLRAVGPVQELSAVAW